MYLSSCLGYLGLVLLKQGNFSESLEFLEQSHVMNRLMYQKLNKGNHIALVWSFTNLGDYYFETRNLSLSLENYSKALNMNKQIYTGFYADDKNKDEFSNCIHP
ncbi:MAG: tetratricopeptide repeat protein, partial [bacterium]